MSCYVLPLPRLSVFRADWLVPTQNKQEISSLNLNCTVCPEVRVTPNTPLFYAICGRILKPFELQVVHMCGFDLVYDMP